MRNNIITFVGLLLMVLTGLSSCEKMVIEEDDNGGQPAVESNANLMLKVSINQSRSDAAAFCKTLNFVVFQNGKKVKGITQKIGSEDFGQVGFKLVPGMYQVMILAHSSAGNPSLLHPDNVKFENRDGFSDTFTAYDDIEVTDTPQTHEISLKRASSMLRVITKDAKPAQVKSIRILYTGGSGAINVLTGYGVDNSKQDVTITLPDSLTGKPISFDLYTFLKADEAELNVKLSALGKNEENKDIILSLPGMTNNVRECSGVPVKRNQITELVGYFFTKAPDTSDDDDTGGGDNTARPDSTASSFTIIADTAWAGITHYDF